MEAIKKASEPDTAPFIHCYTTHTYSLGAWEITIKETHGMSKDTIVKVLHEIESRNGQPLSHMKRELANIFRGIRVTITLTRFVF